MNFEGDSVLARALTGPHPRKSIHDHRMGGYGLHRSPNINERNACRQSEGYDEPDNVMSKHAKHSSSQLEISSTSSPLEINITGSPSNHRECFAYKSNLDNRINNSNPDSCILSKSLPTTLPSYSFSSTSTNERPSDVSDDDSYVEDRSQLEESHNQSYNNNKNKKSPNYFIVGIKYLVTLTLVCVACFFGYNANSESVRSDAYNEIYFSRDVRDLGESLWLQDEEILKIQSGIKTIWRRSDAGSFIFLYNSRHPNYNRASLNFFINSMAERAAKYLRNDSMHVRHIVVNNNDLNMKSHGDFISRYVDDLQNNGVMLINELQEVPSHLAMAFHYYCDEYNPLVKKSAIFFTLDLGKCFKENLKNTHALVELCLRQKWTDGVPQDNIGPLLTRVVDVVVDVNSRKKEQIFKGDDTHGTNKIRPRFALCVLLISLILCVVCVERWCHSYPLYRLHLTCSEPLI